MTLNRAAGKDESLAIDENERLRHENKYLNSRMIDIAELGSKVVEERDEARAGLAVVAALADRWDEADGNGLDSAVQSIRLSTAVAELRAALPSSARQQRPATDRDRQMFEAGRIHRCRTQEGCCEDCETHLGCRCGDENGGY